MGAKYTSKDKPDFSAMSAGEKVKWFLFYYKWLLILAIGVLAFILFAVLTGGKKKETVLNLLAVNGIQEEDETIWDGFLTSHGFEPGKQEVTLNTNLAYQGGMGVMDAYSIPSMATILNAGGADVFLSDEDCFEAMGSLGAFTPISELFPGDEAKEYEDRFVYVEMDPDADPYISDTETAVDGKYARGIRLNKDSLVYQALMYPTEVDIIVALPVSAENALLGKEFIIELLK